MPAKGKAMSTYPTPPNHPDLRLCWPSQRGCGERLMPGRFCQIHMHLCMTCCSSRLKRNCDIGPWEVPPQPERTEAEIAAGRAELAHIRNQLFGYLEEKE